MTEKTNREDRSDQDEGADDAVDLLEEQHRQVRELLAGIERTTGQSRADQFERLVRLLAVHETAEEEVVYPALRASVPGGAELARSRAEEEDRAKKALAAMESAGTESAGFAEGFAELRTMVLEHAKAEEAEVFPALRQHVDPAVLRNLRAALLAAEAVAPTHPHSFAPESATGNLVAGPMVAVVDRVRDAIHAVRR